MPPVVWMWFIFSSNNRMNILLRDYAMVRTTLFRRTIIQQFYVDKAKAKR